MARRPDLLNDPIAPTLLQLAWPMLLGIAAILLFNIVDTFWVGQLGATELAAMRTFAPASARVREISSSAARVRDFTSLTLARACMRWRRIRSPSNTFQVTMTPTE